MIFRNDKSYETNSLYLNLDWYNEGNYVVDETTQQGKLLAEKIKKNYPYFELVIVDNELIDIAVTEENRNEKLAEQMQVKEGYPVISEQEETIALLVLENEDLKQRITVLEGGVQYDN